MDHTAGVGPAGLVPWSGGRGTAILTWVWGGFWLAAAAACAAPWIARLWGDASRPGSRAMRAPLVLGLSLGAVTLVLTVIGLWRLGALGAMACPLVVAATARARRGRPPIGAAPTGSIGASRSIATLVRALRAGDPRVAVGAAGLGVLLAVLGHATYYPFIGDDELARYAYDARLAVLQGRVTDAVQGYPLLLPMAYAYVFLVTGHPAEQLARLVPALLSAATVAATGALGTRWYGTRAGWGAAFVLIASPLYLRWSPNGYVDIPSALFFVLRVGYPTRLAELRRYDYLVAAAWGSSVYAGLGAAGNEVQRALARGDGLEPVYVAPEGDFVVYRIRP